MSLKRSTQKSLKKLHAAIKVAAGLDPYMTLTRLDSFLTFATQNDIRSMEDLRDRLTNENISNSSVYRNISYWLEQSWLRPDGSRPDGEKFIRDYLDPEDHRRKLLTLTPRGTTWCDKLADPLEE